MINNALMQFVDRVFLTHESIESLEAALPSSMLFYIFICFFQSTVAYSGTFVAQYHGAGDKSGAARSYRAGTLLAVAFSFTALLFLKAGAWIFPLFSDSASVVSRANVYYMILTAGSFATLGHMAASAYWTAIGKTRLVFWVNVLGNLLNILLDYILIFGCGVIPALGMAGAAWATVLSTAAQWAVLAFLARGVWREGAGELFPIIRKVLRFGIPSGLYSFLNVISFTIFVFVTGRVGDIEFAVSNACFSINYLLFAPMEGFAMGAATLVAQAQGRKNPVEASAALRRTLVLALSFVAILSIGTVIFHKPILGLFLKENSPSSAVFYSVGFQLIVLMALWQIFDAADIVIGGALKGAGDTRFVMTWMLIASFAFWLPLVFAVRHFDKRMAPLWMTMVAFVVVICAGTAIRWISGAWQKHKLI